MPRVQSTITFGVEAECVKLAPRAQQLASVYGLSHHYDHSITGDSGETLPRSGPDAGVEIITPPLTARIAVGSDGNNPQIEVPSMAVRSVDAVCESMAHTNFSCGIHVHVGKPCKFDPSKSLWEPDKVRTMLIVAKILEDKLFAHVHISRRNNHHCEKIGSRYSRKDFGNFYPVGQVASIKYQNEKRYCWLNLIETVRKGNRTEPGFGGSPATGTIEIRMLGDTRGREYIMAWTKLWLKIGTLVAYIPSSLAINHCCFSDTLDHEFEALKNAYEDDTKISRPIRSASFNRLSVTPPQTMGITPGETARGVGSPLVASTDALFEPRSSVTIPNVTVPTSRPTSRGRGRVGNEPSRLTPRIRPTSLAEPQVRQEDVSDVTIDTVSSDTSGWISTTPANPRPARRVEFSGPSSPIAPNVPSQIIGTHDITTSGTVTRIPDSYVISGVRTGRITSEEATRPQEWGGLSDLPSVPVNP